jgi:hypothetical protein
MTPRARTRRETEAALLHEAWIVATSGKDLPRTSPLSEYEVRLRAERKARRAELEAQRKSQHNAAVSERHAETRAEKRARAESLLALGWFKDSVARELAMRREELTKLLRGP